MCYYFDTITLLREPEKKYLGEQNSSPMDLAESFFLQKGGNATPYCLSSPPLSWWSSLDLLWGTHYFQLLDESQIQKPWTSLPPWRKMVFLNVAWTDPHSFSLMLRCFPLWNIWLISCFLHILLFYCSILTYKRLS